MEVGKSARSLASICRYFAGSSASSLMQRYLSCATVCAALRKSWSTKERKAWVRLLLQGRGEQVVRAICQGRNNKAITTERNYFVRNQHRIAYPRLKALQLPIGSGAVESAIRRVVNLRLKGPCICWYWRRRC